MNREQWKAESHRVRHDARAWALSGARYIGQCFGEIAHNGIEYGVMSFKQSRGWKGGYVDTRAPLAPNPRLITDRAIRARRLEALDWSRYYRKRREKKAARLCIDECRAIGSAFADLP